MGNDSCGVSIASSEISKGVDSFEARFSRLYFTNKTIIMVLRNTTTVVAMIKLMILLELIVVSLTGSLKIRKIYSSINELKVLRQ
jgi:hypothetical protein